MDVPSQSVVSFLESLQDAKQQLGEIWSQYVRRGTQPGRPIFQLAGRNRRSFFFGLPVKGSDERDYDLSVEIFRHPGRRTIKTEAWVDVEAVRICFGRFPNAVLRASVRVWRKSGLRLEIPQVSKTWYPVRLESPEN